MYVVLYAHLHCAWTEARGEGRRSELFEIRRNSGRSAAQWREMETGLNETLSRLWRVAGRASPEETVLRTAPESEVRSAARGGLR
jgi:hypothetical protein